MAEIKSPISGGLKVARRTVSADAFVRAAPAPAPVAQPDPVTTSLIQRNSLALNTVSGQLASLTQQVNSLSASMQAVYTNINQSSGLERRKDIQEQNQERRLAEQQLREGKESIIERRIQNALVAPVQKVAAKASFTLSRVRDFFLTILGGWLINQSIETIKALGEGNKKKLEDIRNNVLKNLGIVGGIYAGIRFGLTTVFNGLTRFASKITAAVAQGLFLTPVQALLDGVKGAANRLIPKIKNILPNFSNSGKGTPPPATPPPAGPARSVAEAEQRVSGQGLNRFGLTSILGAGGLGTLFDVAGGEDPARAAAGNFGAAGLSAMAGNFASKIPGPPWLKLLTGLGAGGFIFGQTIDPVKGFYDKAGEMFGGGNSGANKNLSSQPLNNKIPDVAFNSENLMNDKGTQQQSDVIANASQQDFAQAPLYGEISVDQLSGETLISSSSKISEAQISPIKQEATTKAGSVGPLPEPAPTILPFPIPGSSAKTQPVASSQTGGVANSVPSIDAENKDNYLLVYSHSVYNVPMT
jgi:hypothetical protein